MSDDIPSPTATAPATPLPLPLPPPPPVPGAPLRLLAPLLWVLLLLTLVLGAIGAGAAWLLRSEAGALWLLAKVPGLQVSGWRGPLIGEALAAERLQVDWPGGGVVITGLQADGLRWAWRPDAEAWVGLGVGSLQARRIEVHTGPPSDKPLVAPDSLTWPLRLKVGALRVAELQIDALAPLRDIDAAFELGADTGALHRIDRLRLAWDRLAVDATATLGSAAPLTLNAEARVAPAAAAAAPIADAAAAAPTARAAVPPWGAVLRATGPLARLDAQATLRGVASGGQPAPSLDLHAGIAPFAAWPLLSLNAQTQALDLSALASAAPQTRLSGRVDVDSRSLDAPIVARALLDNALAGRWDEGRLPVTRIELVLQGQATQRDRVDVQTFDLALGSNLGNNRRAAGRLQGQGHWQGDALQIDTRLTDVQPQQLDGRAAPMRLSGSLALALQGLPSPDGQAPAAPRPWGATLRAALNGRLDATPLPVQVVIDASADAERFELTRLQASAGSARAEARLSARRGTGTGTGFGATPWQVASQGRLVDFDPLPWWPGDAGSAWRQGPHRVSADWQIDLRVPAGADRLAPLALAQRLAGSGRLTVHDSLLAGVPLQATLSLENTPNRRDVPSGLRGELTVADNRLTIDGRGDPLGKGDADRWQLVLQGQALAGLAPLFKLDPSLADWAPRQGKAEATVAVTGRWPAVGTEGEISLQQLKAGKASLERATVRWRVDTQGEQPLDVLVGVSQLGFGPQRIEELRADLKGSLRRHRLDLKAALPLVPPAIVEQTLGLQKMSGTRVSLQGEGAWLADAAGGGRWAGHLTRLAAGAWDGKPGGGLVPGDWLEALDLNGELHFGADGNLDLIEAAAGGLRLADAVALRWDEVRVDTRQAQPRITLRAEVEAFSVAPLLARLQPAMGWSGDLQVGARIELKAAERFDAELLIDRRDGDLRISTDGVTQALGLTDLKLSMTARDGQWTLAQALAGTSLGEAAGAVSLTTTADRRWPPPDTPINGVLQARVSNLGVWGAWVPPGWRLTGELTTSASIGGRFDAPEYTGEVRGSGLGMRNLLQGVNVGQGEVAVLLKGATAQIERFSFRAGEGSLNITGGADFGSAPNARLAIEAQRFRVLGRVDRQLIVSGNSDLSLRAGLIKLDGSLIIDEGLFDLSSSNAPTLDSDVTVRRAGDEDLPAEPQPSQRPRREAQVSVDIDLGKNLRVRGRGVDTGLRGRLNISTPGGRLAVRGAVNTEGGTYAAYGQRLDIERGIVAFSGPVDNPRLDILALRPNIDTRVGVAITGTAQIPRIRLYSDPDMSDTDKLSWLMLGRAPDGLGGTDTALLQRAALALLAGEGDAPTDALLRNLGLSELSVRQSDGEVRETVVTVGKQISRRWFVGYERGINAATGTWQLIYRIAQRFTLRAQSGESNSLDLIWIWRLGEPFPFSMPKSDPKPP